MARGPVGRATYSELKRLGAVESVEGRVALRLAEQLDAPRNGMAVAPDAKELRAVIGVLRDVVPAGKADPLDELVARRAGRGAAS